MTLGGGTDVGGRRAGEGEGEGVWLSVASMWFCSIGEGVGVETWCVGILLGRVKTRIS